MIEILLVLCIINLTLQTYFNTTQSYTSPYSGCTAELIYFKPGDWGLGQVILRSSFQTTSKEVNVE